MHGSIPLAHTVAEAIEQLLAAREVIDPVLFFSPLRPDQLSLEGVGLSESEVKTACARIKQAIKSKEQIVIYGDYDADGVCATSLVWLVLHGLGAEVVPFVPDRKLHGYGISELGLQEIMAAEQPPQLLVTVDNGIVAHQAVKQAQTQGVEVIITDHHQPEEELPNATAIVHTTQLCGTTVAWMLMRELVKTLSKTMVEVSGSDHLDLCAIATIADMVSLQAANRSFAYHGLQALSNTTRPGLVALMNQASIDPAKISAGTIGYTLAPRINAAGRLETGMDAVRLLCTRSAAKAIQFAQGLERVNQDRRGATEAATEQALAQVASQTDEHLLVAASTEFEEGIVGLVAGKVVEIHHKPCLVFALRKDIAKGSARSVAGANIVELLRQVSEDLVAVGGHPLAAGCSIDRAKFGQVIARLQLLAKQQLSDNLFVPTSEVDIELTQDVSLLELARALSSFEPFGKGNRTPSFLLRQLVIVGLEQFGRDHQHAKIRVRWGDQRFEVLRWNHQLSEEKVGQITELVVRISTNAWGLQVVG